MPSFKFWSLVGLLSFAIDSVNAVPGSDARVERFQAQSDDHGSFKYWSGEPKSHVDTWKSERTSLYPETSVWYTDTTVAHTTTIYPPSLRNSTIIKSDASTVFWKVTSTSTYTNVATYISSSVTISPPPNPCPTSCKVSAGTVNLFYWPTDQPYDYPTTHFDAHLKYTFTSPSVYMIVDKIYGTNTAGDIVGPSGTSVIFPLDLDEVSTIVPKISATNQLNLNDLRTDCPQTEPASVIATKVPGGPCDPILAAPKKVKSWASPCGACQNFGLFDPPYAVAPITGGLVPMTRPTVEPSPQTTATIASATEITTADERTTPTISQSTTGNIAITLTESSDSFVATIPVILPTSSGQLAHQSETESAPSISPIQSQIPSSGHSAIETPSTSLFSSSYISSSPTSSTSATFAAANSLSSGMSWIMSFLMGILFL